MCLSVPGPSRCIAEVNSGNRDGRSGGRSGSCTEGLLAPVIDKCYAARQDLSLGSTQTGSEQAVGSRQSGTWYLEPAQRTSAAPTSEGSQTPSQGDWLDEKCSPEKFLSFPSSRAMAMTLFPFSNPITEANRRFRRNRDTHVHMIPHWVSFKSLTLLLFRQRVEDRAQFAADMPENRLRSSFGHEHYVVRTLRGTVAAK